MKSVVLHNRITNVLLKSFTLLLFLSFNFSLQAQEVDAERQKEGRKLFKSLCASCHKLDKKLVGPALKGVTDKYEKEWLYKWIRNNAELIASGDALAIEAAEYSPTAMTAFPQLTDKNIDDILYYTVVGDPVIDKGPVNPNAPIPVGGPPEWVVWLLAAAIVVAFLIIASLLKTVSELKGAPKTPGAIGTLNEVWEGVKQNTFLHVLTVIFGALVTAYFLFGTLFSVGVDQGYSPLQPIAFSHKIHAGENKIECQYCHSSAKHSKHSGIPSVNVCMNCHMNISEVAENTVLVTEEKTYKKADLDKEIQKIYKAAGWDSENLEYTGKTQPIKWIRIHNLPDFAYFNHSQHVTVGGIECQKCHGPVETMEELYQFSPLTMGWCIDCHRETKVDLKGNDYYQKIHKQLAKKYGVEQVTIAQLGGLECGKCHY